MNAIPSIRSAGRGVWNACVALLLLMAAAGVPVPALADEPPDAARRVFPEGSRFVPVPLDLTRNQLREVRDRADVRVRTNRIQVWHVEGSEGERGWLIIDEVLGKHEFITYSVGIEDGRVTGIEILEYRESYGGEVQRPSWRQQFHGRQLADGNIRLGRGIDNIAGATLSARNVTDGVRKLLILVEYLEPPRASGR